jgi:hypothetical protein
MFLLKVYLYDIRIFMYMYYLLKIIENFFFIALMIGDFYNAILISKYTLLNKSKLSRTISISLV